MLNYKRDSLKLKRSCTVNGVHWETKENRQTTFLKFCMRNESGSIAECPDVF